METRSATIEQANEAESEELLTTGEAAKLLSSSRQHVVNLCNAGDLPYLTVGNHRRVRRRDVEALRTRSQRPNRGQRRSLWLNTAVAGRLVVDPNVVLRLPGRTCRRSKCRIRVGRRRTGCRSGEVCSTGRPNGLSKC